VNWHYTARGSRRYDWDAPPHRQVLRARNAVARATRDGKLDRPNQCSGCGAACKPEAHHHNGYDDEHALDVVWLCRPCHRGAHGNRI
jgi:hypothetical protein